MARVEKYTSGAVSYQLRHNTRECPKPPSNIEIESERTPLNYTLISHGSTAKECYEYYKQRLSEVYVYGNKAVNTMASWVITAPADLSETQEKDFFEAATDYCNSLYGEKNVIQAVVHKDEGIKNSKGVIVAGRPHLHYSFIPVVQNNRYMKPNAHGNITEIARYQEKVCANDLINKRHLQNWHKDFQELLNIRGIKCSVINGATSGGNRTVSELKDKTKIELLTHEKEQLQKIINDLEKSNSIERSTSPWSHSAGWSKGDKTWENEF